MTKKPNPLEEYQDFKTKESNARQQQSLQMWHAWKQAPDHEKPEKLEPLLNRYQGTFAQKVRQWKSPIVPESAFHAELQKQFVKALETYDPNKAAISTHVNMYLNKAQRLNNRAANVGYLPEGQSGRIGKIQRAQDELTEQFGRAPTPAEISEHLAPQFPDLTPKRVGTILTNKRHDFSQSSLEFDPNPQAASREREVLGLLPETLTPDELKVFNHIYGLDGHQKITQTNAIAAKLQKNPTQISRLRSSITAKYNRYK